MKCKVCGTPAFLFRCNYCGGLFCAEHHLPPNHDCPNLHLWKAKPPPGLTMRYEGRRYASVDVPFASEPRIPAAAERASYNTQLDTVKPYNRGWRRGPVEGVKRRSAKTAKPERYKSWDVVHDESLPILFVLLLLTFITSFAGLFSAREDLKPIFLFLFVASLIGIIAILLLVIKSVRRAT